LVRIDPSSASAGAKSSNPAAGPSRRNDISEHVATVEDDKDAVFCDTAELANESGSRRDSRCSAQSGIGACGVRHLPVGSIIGDDRAPIIPSIGFEKRKHHGGRIGHAGQHGQKDKCGVCDDTSIENARSDISMHLRQAYPPVGGPLGGGNSLSADRERFRLFTHQSPPMSRTVSQKRTELGLVLCLSSGKIASGFQFGRTLSLISGRPGRLSVLGSL
jgi:hypothetical protein